MKFIWIFAKIEKFNKKCILLIKSIYNQFFSNNIKYYINKIQYHIAQAHLSNATKKLNGWDCFQTKIVSKFIIINNSHNNNNNLKLMI